jgi:hypothetical protein
MSYAPSALPPAKPPSAHVSEDLRQLAVENYLRTADELVKANERKYRRPVNADPA